MWALPDIGRLNAEAERAHKARKGRPPTKRGKTCDYCNEKAVVVEQYYDIFGDKDIPKGEIPLCEEHADNGILHENYFWCDGCSRYHATNYTWELYRHFDEKTCQTLCLRCYFEEEIANEENWIAIPEQISFERVRQAKHLIAVESTYWKDHLVFIGNVTLDASTGEEVIGFSSTSGNRHSGVEALKRAARAAIVSTHINTKGEKADCILILDGGYQFAVSIGVYARKG